MIEIIAALARWLQLVANMILIGGSVFLAIAAYDRAVLSRLLRPSITNVY